jgi:hypothetical protein
LSVRGGEKAQRKQLSPFKIKGAHAIGEAKKNCAAIAAALLRTAMDFGETAARRSFFLRSTIKARSNKLNDAGAAFR